MVEPAPAERILVHAPSWIGDVVMATAAFRELRRAYPKSRISFLVKPGRDRVIGEASYCDEAIIDRSSGSPLGVLRMAAELRRRRFDLAVLFADSFRARVLAFLAGIPRRVGYVRDLGGLLLTKRLRYPGGSKKPEPMPLRFRRLIEALGIPGGDTRPELVIDAGVEERARQRRESLGIPEGEALVGLNPGASFGSSKIWPPEHFARLGDLLADRHGLRSIIFVGPGEEAIARDIESRMRHPVISTADDHVPLDELKVFIRDLRLLVTTDTGPRHYAVAFRVPVVVLMGSTDPRYTDLHLEESVVLRKADLPCIACHLKTCPIEGHPCMRTITPEEALDAVAELDRRRGVFRGAP